MYTEYIHIYIYVHIPLTLSPHRLFWGRPHPGAGNLETSPGEHHHGRLETMELSSSRKHPNAATVTAPNGALSARRKSYCQHS